jgi:hypothetical protein
VSEAAGTSFEERLSALEAAHALRIEKLERERDEYKKLVLILQEQVERLKRGLLGQKAERLPANDAQLSLAILNLAIGSECQRSPSRIHRRSAKRIHDRAQAARRQLACSW